MNASLRMFDVVPFDISPGQRDGQPPAAQALIDEELLALPRLGNGAVCCGFGSVRRQKSIAICGLLGLPLTRVDRREKQKVIDGLESHGDSILVRCSQPTQQTEKIQDLTVEQTISSLMAGNRGVQGVGTAIRAGLIVAIGNHVFPTDGGLHRG
jgi:hypothetical protein